MDLAELVSSAARLFKPADPQHPPQYSMPCSRVIAIVGEPPPASRCRPQAWSSRAFNRRRMILPLLVFGRSAENTISFGATTAPEAGPGHAEQVAFEDVIRLRSRSSARQRPSRLPGDGVRLPDHGRFPPRPVFDKDAFDLKGADEIRRVFTSSARPRTRNSRLYLAWRRVTGSDTSRLRNICSHPFRFMPIATEHRRPARPQRQFSPVGPVR